MHDISGGSDRLHITVHCCGSTSRISLPPYILYKGKYLYKDWMDGGLAGTLYRTSDSGWMEEKNFLEWFNKAFLSAVAHLAYTLVLLSCFSIGTILILPFVSLKRLMKQELICSHSPATPHTSYNP